MIFKNYVALALLFNAKLLNYLKCKAWMPSIYKCPFSNNLVDSYTLLRWSRYSIIPSIYSCRSFAFKSIIYVCLYVNDIKYSMTARVPKASITIYYQVKSKFIGIIIIFFYYYFIYLFRTADK